eukprot:3644142-Rhodomonas_salina.5
MTKPKGRPPGAVKLERFGTDAVNPQPGIREERQYGSRKYNSHAMERSYSEKRLGTHSMKNATQDLGCCPESLQGELLAARLIWQA